MPEAAALVAAYLDEGEARWCETTLESRRSALCVFLEYAAGRPLTPDVVLGFVQHVSQGKRKRDGVPWAPRTRQQYLYALRDLLRWAERRGRVLQALSSLIRLRAVKTLPRVLPEKNVNALLESSKGAFAIRNRAILELLYGTGLRVSEVCRLRLGDLALAERLVHVHQGKGRKDRVVPLGETAATAVLEYLRVRASREGPLFLGNHGRGLTTDRLFQIVQAAGREAGFTASPHRLRHSFATHLLRNGAGVREVQALLGHSSIISTQVYLDVEVSDLARMLERCHPRERGKEVAESGVAENVGGRRNDVER